MSQPPYPPPLAARLRAFALAAFALCVLLLAAGCTDDKPDPNTPDGSLRLFVQTIADGDKDALWSYLDRDTRQLFKHYLTALFELDAQIKVHFANDPEEQLRLRALTGVGKTINDLSKEALKRPPKEQQITPKDLFITVINPSSVTVQRDHEVGAQPDKVELSEDKQTATVTTKSGQVYQMVFDTQAKAWRVARSSPAFLVADPVAGEPKETTEILPDGSQRPLLIVTAASGLTYYMNKIDDVWQVEGISGAFLKEDDGAKVVIIDVFAQAFVPLQNSVKALEQLTEERMSEERTRRERVIKLFDDAIQARTAPGGQP